MMVQPEPTEIAAQEPHTSAEPSAWQNIGSARKDGTIIWAAMRSDIYPVLKPEREDLARWNGVQIPLRHPGVYEDQGRTWDHGWNIAAPVGHGGFPDEWIAGWMPLPDPPRNEAATPASQSPGTSQ